MGKKERMKKFNEKISKNIYRFGKEFETSIFKFLNEDINKKEVKKIKLKAKRSLNIKSKVF
tara:strand:+ start:11063 stop:11245 length:183 start_codon:yes stop_codon:yes gene_type:complete